MKLTTLLTTLLSAKAVIAAPFIELRHEQRAARQQARAVNHSHPPYNITTADTYSSASDGVNAKYTSNWAGAVLKGSGYKSVTGTIVVPTPELPFDGNYGTLYAAAAWVGIGGNVCSGAILQTGVDFWLEDGKPIFTAWCEWLPEPPHNFEKFIMKAGDLITMTVTAKSTSSGTATLKNHNTSQIVSHTFKHESTGICELNAEWIIEDFMVDGYKVPLVDFTEVTFKNASVTTTSGATLGVEGATILDIVQNNLILTSCSTIEDSSVRCSYA